MQNNHAQPQDQSSTFGLMDLLNIIFYRWKIGLLVGAFFGGAFVFIVLSQEDVYEASTAVAVELRAENITDFRQIVDTDVGQHNLLQTVINTHIERIKTRLVAEIVVDILTDEEIFTIIEPFTEDAFVRADPEGSVDVAGILMSRCIEVYSGDEDDSQVIRIAAMHPDPASAMRIANAYADAFLAYKSSVLSESTERAAIFLGRQVDAMRGQVKASERELQDFRQANNLVTVEQSQSIIFERMKRINDALTAAKIREFEARARVNQVDAAGDDIEMLMRISFIGGDEEVSAIYNQLSELRRERKVLDDTYLARHPRILENSASQSSVQEALEVVLAQRKEHVKSAYDAIASEITELESSLLASEEAVLATESAMVDYRMLENDLNNKRETFSQLLTRYNETLVAREIESSSFTILDRATQPKFPNSPSNIQVGAAAVVLGGFFFVFLPLALEILDTRLKSFNDIESFIKKPVLGDLSFYGTLDFKTLAKSALDKRGEVRESFRAIYGSLRMKCDLGKSEKTLLVTSSLPGEGKSTIAANLAICLANHGYSVLLVDLDFRRPVQHAIFDLDNELGLLNWLEKNPQNPQNPQTAVGCEEFSEQSVASQPDLGIEEVSDGLSLLRSGGTAEMPTEALDDSRVGALLARCREAYDLVIIDSPPVGVFLDSTLLAEHADCSVFVASQFKAKKNKVRYAVNLMERSEAPILGVVFNGIRNPKVAMGYGDSSEMGHYAAGYEGDRSRYRAHYAKQA